MADALLRLAALTGDSTYREHAQVGTAALAQNAHAAGPFAATYARALRRYLRPELSVRIVGDAGSDRCVSRSGAPSSSTLYGDSYALTERGCRSRHAGRTGRLSLHRGNVRRARRDPAALRDAYDAIARYHPALRAHVG